MEKEGEGWGERDKVAGSDFLPRGPGLLQSDTLGFSFLCESALWGVGGGERAELTRSPCAQENLDLQIQACEYVLAASLSCPPYPHFETAHHGVGE